MAKQLEAQIGLQSSGGGAAMAGAEDRSRALVSSMLSSIDRSINIATTRSCCVEGRLMQPAGAVPESPQSADGSAASDHGTDSRSRANAARPQKRKTLPKWSTQVRVCSVKDVGPLDDGFSWRKYGQKDILGAKYPRAYFRCTHRHTQGCQASKQVQRADGDPLLFDVAYHGNHTCAQGARSVVDGQARPRPTTNEEQQQPPPSQPGQEQNAISVGIKLAKDEGRVQALQEPTSSRPFTFTSTANGGAGALLHGCATSDCQVSGSVYELGGGSMAGVRNVPDVELPSKTNPSMGEDIEFMFMLDRLDADFLDKYSAGYF